MTRLFRAFGTPLSALILLFSGIWIFGLIAAPQLIMIEQSLWRMERPTGAAEISVQIDGLYNQLDVLALDRATVEAETDAAKRAADLAAIDAKEAGLKVDIAAFADICVADDPEPEWAGQPAAGVIRVRSRSLSGKRHRRLCRHGLCLYPVHGIPAV